MKLCEITPPIKSELYAQAFPIEGYYQSWL